MKKAVIQLVASYGKPSDDWEIPNNFNKIIDDVKSKVSPVSSISSLQEQLPDTYLPNSTNLTNLTNSIKKGMKFMFDADLNYSYGQSFIQIIDAIKKGYITNNDIACVTGINSNLLSVKYRDFCRTLENKNLLNGLEGKTYLQKIISFVNKRMNKTKEKPYIPAPGDIIIEQINVPVKRKPDTNSNEIEQLKTENEQLKARIQELENQPKQVVDFGAVKAKIISKIDELNQKLKAIELLETTSFDV